MAETWDPRLARTKQSDQGKNQTTEGGAVLELSLASVGWLWRLVRLRALLGLSLLSTTLKYKHHFGLHTIGFLVCHGKSSKSKN
jgi:hypothetical protein